MKFFLQSGSCSPIEISYQPFSIIPWVIFPVKSHKEESEKMNFQFYNLIFIKIVVTVNAKKLVLLLG